MKLCFISILAEPGTYDRATFAELDGGDNECVWFENSFGHLPDVSIHGYRVAEGEAAPDPGDGDLFILGGSYNSVHDGFAWQTEIYHWLDKLRASGKPLLAICGGHQMICHAAGAPVEYLPGGFIAGTEAVSINQDGLASPLFKGFEATAKFHFGNQEHVTEIPPGARQLASHDKAAIAALDYGGGWYSTQFHPEATVQAMSICWRESHPEFMKNYGETASGLRMIENFVGMI